MVQRERDDQGPLNEGVAYDDEMSDAEIEAIMDEALASTDGQELDDDGDEGHRTRPENPFALPPRALVATLICFAVLVPLISFATVAIVAGAGPELLGENRGGDLDVELSPYCHEVRGTEQPCFEPGSVNITISSTNEPVLEPGPPDGPSSVSGWYDARMSVVVETNLGVWKREYWIPDGVEEKLVIRPDSPKEVDGVIGRDVNLAVLSGLGAILALVTVIASGVWLFAGTIRSARVTRAALIVGLVIQTGWVLAGVLGTGAIPFGPVVVLVFTWFLWRGVDRWIGRAREPEKAALSVGVPPAAEQAP